MSERSRIAYDISGETLAGIASGKLKLWTFSMEEAVDVGVMRRQWNNLLRNLRRAYPNLKGLRVYEMHPGESADAPEGMCHGLHAHAITPQWWDVNVLRAFLGRMRDCLFGRIHVMPTHSKKAWRYLVKYLSKYKRPPCLKGWRLWAHIGNWEHTKCKDLVLDSRVSRVWVFLGQTAHFNRLNWYERNRRVQGFLKWVDEGRHWLEWKDGVVGGVVVLGLSFRDELQRDLIPSSMIDDKGLLSSLPEWDLETKFYERSRKTDKRTYCGMS